MYGVDYSKARPSIASLKAAGVKFVCRYLSTAGNPKNLDAAEARALHAAGIAVVLVWETTADRMLSGKAGGTADARTADAQAKALGMAGVPIYFACDWDATEAQQAAINAYLDGAAGAIGRSRVGMYGGYWPVSRARAAGKASYYWGAPAWSGTNWKSASWKPELMQGAGATIGGGACDADQSNAADFGQWPRPAAPKPKPSAVITDGILVSKAMHWTGHKMKSADGGKTWTAVNP